MYGANLIVPAADCLRYLALPYRVFGLNAVIDPAKGP
jgi:hypothetical protein